MLFIKERFLLCILICLLAWHTRAQDLQLVNQYIDSLILQLPGLTDSAKVDQLNEIAYNFFYYKHDSTGKYAKQAYELATEINYSKGMAEAQRLIGISYKAGNKEGLAFEWLMKGLQTAEDAGYDQGIADNLNSIGIFFASVEDHIEAIAYFKKSLNYQISAKNKLREGILYSNLGESMLKVEYLDSSYYFFQQAESILDSIADKRWIAMIKSRFARYWYVIGDYKKAENYAKYAVELSRQLNQPIHLRNAYLVLTQVYLERGQIENAQTCAGLTLKLSSEIGFLAYMVEAYELQYRLKKAQGQYQASLDYHEQFSAYRDSLRRDQIVSESNLVRFQMKLLQKEKENNTLRKEKETSDAQSMANQNIIRRQTLIVISIMFILFLVTVFAIVFFRSRQKERESNAQLTASNAGLEEQKEELSATLQMVEHLNAQLQAQNNTLNKMAIVSITDLDGHIISINKNFCDVSGYSRDELQGTNHRILNSGEHPLELFQQMWQSINSGKTWRGELKNKKKNGDYFWADTAIAPILNDEGKPKQFFSLQFDITERKDYLNELSSKSDELEELNKLKDKLLSIISHDFRGPLNSLRGMLNLFLQGALSNEELGMLTESLVEKLDNTYNLLENLLSWAKSQMQGTKVYAREINLQAISEDCLALLIATAEKKLVKIETNIREPIFVYADNEMIKLVLRNLISNAIKFTTAGNKIILDVEQKGNQVIVSVKDNGMGISNENQFKLFKLENYSTSGTSNETGMGLGLLLCKDFVEKNNGTIWFESELGKGSNFFFSLPAMKQPDQI